LKPTVFLCANDSLLHWHGNDGDSLPSASAWRQGSIHDAASDPMLGNADVTLVLPAQKVSLREVAFVASERRLLRQTIPYSLEEQLVDDVDTQHFALGVPQGERVPVAIVDREWLRGWLDRCAHAGLDIKRVLPEQLLLPYRQQCWTLRAEAQRWLVRVGPYRGFAMEPESAAFALQLLLDSSAELPQRLLLQSEQPLAEISSQLPELLRGIIEPLEPAAAIGTPTIDLLQGAFARTLPWRRWWQQWRTVAVVLGVALAVQIAVLAIERYRLQQQNLSLRQQIEAVYRGVEPRGVVNDPELQLRRKLKGLLGSGGSSVMPLLQQVGGALQKVEGVSLQNMTYSEQQHELRISITASTFKDVEALRVAVVAAGLNAQLIGSNTDGSKTRAQLRINERSR